MKHKMEDQFQYQQINMSNFSYKYDLLNQQIDYWGIMIHTYLNRDQQKYLMMLGKFKHIRYLPLQQTFEVTMGINIHISYLDYLHKLSMDTRSCICLKSMKYNIGRGYEDIIQHI